LDTIKAIPNESSPKTKKSKKPVVIVNGKVISSNERAKSVEEKIKGKTLEIYNYIVRKQGDVGVREIQQKFDYSSPSLAAYHLNKLLEYDIITKNETNRYFISNQNMKLGIHQTSIRMGNFWIPKYIVTSLFTIFLGLLGLIYYIVSVGQIVWAVTYISSMSLLTLYLLKSNRK
jgi:hypothetical protein